MTRILLTTDAVGGVWRYTIDLASGLSAHGIPPIVAVLGPAPTQAHRDEANAIPTLHLVQTGLPLDWTAETPAALAHATNNLATLATLMSAQSIHLHAPALVGQAEWPAPAVAVAHSCVGTWWNAVRTGPLPPDFAWRAAAAAAGLARAAAIIAPSAAHATALRTVYGPLPIQVVHNGIMLSKQYPEPNTSPTPDPANPSRQTRDRAILTAGRLWDEAKSAALLDQAAATLDAPIRAAGPTEGPNGARIHFSNLQTLGTLNPEAMAQAYATSTVYASLARYEPFGLAVLEAAQSGMRLVLSDIPTFRELWDGVATFVPLAAGPATLAHILREALDSPGDGGARERAKRYTQTAMVEGTLAVHRALSGTS